DGNPCMLSVNAVTFDIDGIRILDDVTFSIPAGEKVGLVGANGSGKSTLLQLIAGQRKPTSGSIQFIGGGAIGYLPQVPFDTGNATVFDMLARGASGWTAARDAMERALEQLSAEGESSDDHMGR